MSHSVKLIWATPDIDKHLVYHARISVPENKRNLPGEKLIAYLFEHNHVSPGDMVNVCVGAVTTRAIGRQMLRHWSIKPQEYSQRYANPLKEFGGPIFTDARLQDKQNRQQSIETDDTELKAIWQTIQEKSWNQAEMFYDWAIQNGIAKEVARNILPEGLTPTRMDFNGSVRSWLHFCDLRRKSEGAQSEIEILSNQVWEILKEIAPLTTKAWEDLRAKKELNKRKLEFVDWMFKENIKLSGEEGVRMALKIAELDL